VGEVYPKTTMPPVCLLLKYRKSLLITPQLQALSFNHKIFSMMKKITYVMIFFFINSIMVTSVSAQMSKELVKVENTFPADNTEGEPELLSFEKRLKILIEEDDLFLNPHITLNEIARLLRTSPSVVSSIMESGFGEDYNTFINSRRVKSAIEILNEPEFQAVDYDDKNAVELAASTLAKQCGFKSTGQFFKQFKKHHGMKLEEYLEEQQD